MTNNPRNEKITTFVRDILGCGCPDEVFNKIEVSVLSLVPEITTVTRIVVGDTLLIYILPDTPVDMITKYVGKLVVTGKRDRDLHGYNRFRLVVPSCNDSDQEGKVSALFAAVAENDEKLHIHYVDADVMGAIL